MFLLRRDGRKYFEMIVYASYDENVSTRINVSYHEA
jgi:hypothetical protein